MSSSARTPRPRPNAHTTGRHAAAMALFRDHAGLLPLRNVVLAPHIASGSAETRVAMSSLAIRNCLAVLEGKPPLTPIV